LIQYSFSLDDQIGFAQLAGDYNPAHLDPIKARRTRFGKLVVHGIHALIWALEILFHQNSDSLKLVSLKTYFNQPIGLGDPVQFILKTKDKTQAEIQLLCKSEQAVRIIICYERYNNKNYFSFPDSNPEVRDCLDRNPGQLANASGSLELCLNKIEAALRFPNLMRVLPSNQLAELMALTRLVGMECPGLHSIFSDLNIDFSNSKDDSTFLSYEVLSYDSRISLLTQNVQSPSMKGVIRAFLRPPPKFQETYQDLSKQVKKEEFSNQTALIIGGSRGLGEVTGKLLAGGGARVVITYHLGVEEACTIIKQIIEGGGDAKCLAYNALCPNLLQNEDLAGDWFPTHLYYFPTPLIFRGQKNTFSEALFQEFCDYYVTGFFNIFQTIQKPGDRLQGVFYPSTVAIDELPADMAEYTTAKSAGETLCEWLRKKYPQLNIFNPRLPRTATDQTNSLLPSDNKDPASLMIENLRQFRDKGNPIS
jgi:NAD(P)-dependent dehydrogenase (short-subunit alcohol dehydrogenase family)